MQNSKGKAIASLICGIVSVVLAWFGYGAIAGLAAGIVAIVLGVGVRKLNDENKNFATAGLVTRYHRCGTFRYSTCMCYLCSRYTSYSRYA